MQPYRLFYIAYDTTDDVALLMVIVTDLCQAQILAVKRSTYY